MKISLKVTQPEKAQKTCVIIGVFEKRDLSPSGKAIDAGSNRSLTKILKQAAFEGKIGQVLPVFHLSPAYPQVIVVGCGKKENILPNNFRKIIIAAAKALEMYQISEALCYFTELPVDHFSLAFKVRQIIEVLDEGLYRFELFKSEKARSSALTHLIIHLPTSKDLAACQTAVKQGQAIAEAVSFTKNLANLPSNICTPAFLADQAQALAKANKAIKVKIIEEKEMRKLGMGAILAVAQGSAQDAKLICLEYHGANKKLDPIALVGKGVTFDTGGNSLKPPDSMVGMKYDMCGAATVLGTLKAAAKLSLPINIVGIIAAVENMPGGTAYKPEDIITGLSGKTIEVISTDAEGRLILSDALTYCQRYQPDVVIDIATLTGAVVVALGIHATGLLSNNEALAKALLKAGEESNDRAWQLPLWEDYQEQINSPFADMANSGGGRTGGAITAACFLSRFTQPFRWAHLDVAGTAAIMAGVSERKATGRPVPLLVQYLIDRSAHK